MQRKGERAAWLMGSQLASASTRITETVVGTSSSTVTAGDTCA